MISKSLSIWVTMSTFLVFSCGLLLPVASADTGSVIINVGVIVDSSTRIGKEEKVGVEVAAKDFNNTSKDYKLSLHFARSNNGDPLQAAYSAIDLINEKGVEAIIGTDTGQGEIALLGEIGNQYKVPILSMAEAPASLLSSSNKWPFLVKMDSNYTAQILCIASLVKYHQWRRVVVVYEDNGYDAGTSLMLDLLSQALQAVESEIEYRLALPPLALMKDPKEEITMGLVKVFSTQSRVFVVLHSSLPLAINLFREAKNIGLVGRETAWIVTDSIGNLLDSINSSSISYMEGTLAIKSYYDEYSQSFKNFNNNFLLSFLSQYPEEDSFYPGIHALRAYDAITSIRKSLEGLGNKTLSPNTLLQGISSTKFVRLSGEISYKNGELEEDGRLFRIVNVVGKKYKELDYWSSKMGFFETLSHQGEANYSEVFNGTVHWPGDINHIPKGWAMPTNAKPLKIGVPGRTSFEKFVKVNVEDPNRTTYSGFCIDVFLEVVNILEESYALPYEFEAFNGTYDELVDCVYNKTYDAVVGDVTILANRSKYVEFTQPYTKSGLSMIVPLKSKESQKALIFLKPFTWQMWLASVGTLLYTMLIVWLVESRNNPDFGGTLKNQISASLWFTFTSIFFAQKEKIQSNFTRITVVGWLFVVFVLTSSYTANLTSMLTVPLLEPEIKDIKSLVKTNAIVGCDGDSFVRDYLVNVLEFRPENIQNISSQYSYPDFFANGSIVAAFIELPYAKVFLNQYCKSFTQTKHNFRFGGLGFVFQKGSPLAIDVSKAILKLSENGVLKQLDDKWFPPSSECSSSSSTDNNPERLDLQGFWVIYIFSVTISTFCFLLFVIRVLMSYRRHKQSNTNVITLNESIWNRLARFAHYYDKGEIRTPERPLAISETPTTDEDWVLATWAVTTDHNPNALPSLAELEMALSPTTRRI